MYKVADPSPSCTAGLLPYLYLLREEFPLWDFEPRIVAGGRVTTVPKSAKTDRLICIEPDLNVLVQLGIGKALRRRLRRVGLLFSDAQLRNQRGAEEGSSLGQLATVDLSSASDTISSELVRALIPSDWLEALEASRSPVALVKGNSKPLNKFSAMGCGYTFELETLIFWAISSVLVQLKPEWDQRVLVYGDDIIVDRRVVPQLAEVFEEVGFTLNPKKTFSDGPFRESCGRHYFRGVDVTPFYVREVLEGQKWCWAANTVRRYSRLAWGLDSRWKPVYDFCISNLPSAFHVLIPDGYGDGGLISDFDEATPSIAPGGQQGYVYSAFADLAVLGNRGGFRRLRKSLWLLERSLQGVQLGRVKTQVCFRPDAVGSSTSVRHRVRKLTGLVAAQWPSYGPWL